MNISQFPVETLITADTYSDSNQMSTQRQENDYLIQEIKPFEITEIHIVAQLKILPSTTLWLKTHCFNQDQQHFHSLPKNASQIARTAFLSFLIEIYVQDLTKGAIYFIRDPMTKRHTFFHGTIFCPTLKTLPEFLKRHHELYTADRRHVFKKTIRVSKRIAPVLNTAAAQSEAASEHRIAGQDLADFDHLIQTFSNVQFKTQIYTT